MTHKRSAPRGSDDGAPQAQPARQLSASAKARLNALLAEGLSFDEALRRCAAWQDAAPAPASTEPRLSSTAAPDPRLDAFVARLIGREIAEEGQIVGCSADEIAQLEAQLGRSLPRAYRVYLERMGKRAGRLFTWDHLAVTLDHLVGQNEAARARVRKLGAQHRLALPKDAVVISGRLGEQWLFIRARPDDSPVWHLAETGEVKQVCASVLDWLIGTADACEEAIASGYFVEHPAGTTP